MANVRELFAELFAYVLLFEQTLRRGDAQPSYEKVRHDISALLTEQEAAARRQGVPEPDYRDACFAVLAWADETILENSTWQHRDRWEASPLQVEYFQTWSAGEEFFERLGRLRPEQKEIREIYYLCLGLGFSGQYLEDEVKIAQILREQAPGLPRPVEDIQALNWLTSQPYEVPDPGGKPSWPRWTHLLPKAGLALLLAVPLVVFLALVIGGRTNSGSDVKSGPEEPGLAQRLEKALTPYQQQCTKISIESVDAQTGVVSLGGLVTGEAQRAEIRKLVQSIKGVTRVNDLSQVVLRIFCEVIDLLEPLRDRSEKQGTGLAMRLNKPGGNPVYYSDELLSIEVRAPAKFESYLYVDYYSTDAKVTHLFPNGLERMRLFPRNDSYTVGQPGYPDRKEWKIQPPPGLELVTLIASSARLFPPQRFGLETEEGGTYLNELRRVLPNDISKGEVAATFHFITNQDR